MKNLYDQVEFHNIDSADFAARGAPVTDHIEHPFGKPSHDQLIASADMWTDRAESHVQAARFAFKQAERYIARLALEAATDPSTCVTEPLPQLTYSRPLLILFEGGLSPNYYHPDDDNAA